MSRQPNKSDTAADASGKTYEIKPGGETEVLEDSETAMPDRRKVAVITGASSGIGRATALEFARQGYDVVLTARREKELQKVAEECEEHGVRAIGVVADTTDMSALARVSEAAILAFDGFDVWVNDAAVTVYGSFLDTPEEDFRRVLDTNVMGYVHGARLAMTQFKLQGRGTLINVSSINAVAPVPYSSAYVTSKYAVRGLSDALRMELENEGLAGSIHVSTIMPSSSDTNFFQNAANYTGREVQALEPVYDPSYAAKHIVRQAMSDSPKREVIVGPAGKLMAAERAAMPKLYEKLMSAFTERNNFGEGVVPPSKGNLYAPVEANTGAAGGWREKRLRADTMNAALGLATVTLIGLAGAGYMMARRSRS